MTTNTNNLSRPQRQTLASQIDRLETILAGLTETLGQTVAEAVQDAVGKAVELAVKEVLTNPELLRAVQAQTAPTAEPAKEGSVAKTLRQTYTTVHEKASSAGTALRQKAGWAWSKLGGVCAWIGGGLKTAWTAICAGCKKLASGCVSFVQMLPALLMILWTYRKPLLIAVTVGLVVGLGCYFAGPLVSATFSGLMGFLGALVVNLLQRLRQLMEAVRVRSGWVGESD
jgi:hypothetical protein